MLHKNNLMLNGGEIFPAVFFAIPFFLFTFADAKQNDADIRIIEGRDECQAPTLL